MIHIELYKKLDYSTYKAFRDLRFAGLDFGEEIRISHPKISKSNYKEYISEYYKKHETEMIEVRKQITQILSQKSSKFYSAINELFGKDYSKHEYMGYLSMFYCNPRFLDDNSFQIYYERENDDLLQTIFHEVLHFIFFDYCKHNIPETKNLDCNGGPLWELSEIIDVLILNSKEFQQILNKKNELCYPDLTKKLEIIENIWKQGLPISEFIKESLKKLPNN